MKTKALAMLLVSSCFIGMASAARSSDVIERTFQVGSGGRLTLESAMGSIEVSSGAADRVLVRVFREADLDQREFEQQLNRFSFQFEQAGNDVQVRVERRDENDWNRGRKGRLRFRFQVEVPFEYNLNLATAGGSIHVSDLEGEVEARTAGGSLSFGQIGGYVLGVTAGGSIRLEGSGADAELKTAGGSIQIGRVSGNVEAKTSGGSIQVEEVYGSIQAATAGGSVSARILSQPAGDCRLTTSGGGVTVELADGVGLEIDAKTNSGRVISELDLQARSASDKRNLLQGEVGGGGPRLVLRTSGGNIRLHRFSR